MLGEDKNPPAITGDSKKPCIFPPFLGEFGIMIYHYIKFVHFYKCPRKIVMCPKEERVFYPSADEFIDYPVISGRHDRYNLMTGDVYKKLTGIAAGLHPECKVALFVGYLPKNITDLTFDLKLDINKLPTFDVSIGSRGKSLYDAKNYDKWNEVSSILSKKYRIATVGTQKFSQEIISTVPSWFWGDDSSNTCSILKNSRVYVGNDCGITHLACFLQIPTILVRFPKHIIAKLDKVGSFRYGNGMLSSLTSVNKNFIRMSNNWDHPQKIADEIDAYLTKPLQEFLGRKCLPIGRQKPL